MLISKIVDLVMPKLKCFGTGVSRTKNGCIKCAYAMDCMREDGNTHVTQFRELFKKE